MAANQADLAELGMAPVNGKVGAKVGELSAPVAGPDSGLSVAQAAQRLSEDGPNALPGGQRRSLWSISVETVRS